MAQRGSQVLAGEGSRSQFEDGRGRTALQLTVKSAYHGASMSKEMMAILPEHGADPNLTDEGGLSPLGGNIRDPEVAELLVSYGGKANRPNRFSALCQAIIGQNLEAVRDILE